MSGAFRSITVTSVATGFSETRWHWVRPPFCATHEQERREEQLYSVRFNNIAITIDRDMALLNDIAIGFDYNN
jgi:hypothetical protein